MKVVHSGVLILAAIGEVTMLTKLLEELKQGGTLTPVTSGQIDNNDSLVLHIFNDDTINNKRIQVIDSTTPEDAPDLTVAANQNPTAHVADYPVEDGLFACLSSSPKQAITCAGSTPSTYVQLNENDLFDFDIGNVSYSDKTFDEMAELLATVNIELVPMIVSASNEITATYDGFMQTMTVNGQAGLNVETSDALGNVVGSGVIPQSGVLTYTINDDAHDRSVPIFTKSSVEESNVVEHALTVSYFAECYIDENTTQFNPPMGFFAKSIAQRVGLSNNAWDNVQFDENANGRIYLEWTWGEHKEISILTMDDLRAAFTVRYGSDFYPSDDIWNLNLDTSQPSLKVRFDVDTPIVFGMTYANLVHKFFDDGTDKTIGYRFATDFTENYCIRKVPTYLPKSVKIMDFMFASGGNKMFETAAAADNLALWDVGHVVSMNSTFAETNDPIIPISLWRPVKLTSMSKFMSASACTGLGVSGIADWKTPLLVNINEAFIQRYTGNKYYSDLSNWCVPLITEEPEIWHSGQMIPPVWGTCPV